MVETRTASSLAEDAYARIRADVIAGRVRPGARLKINEIGETLNVNVSAVREALSRLSAEGLAVALPQRGFRVAAVSASELLDLTRTRIEIEQLCLRKAVDNPDIEWEAELAAAARLLLRSARGPVGREPDREWVILHARFHHALVAGCGSAWLLRLREHLFVQAQRYLALSIMGPGARRNVEAEHRGLSEAMLARNADLACERIAAHYQRTTDLILKAGFAEGA